MFLRILAIAVLLAGCTSLPAPAPASGIYGVAMMGPTCPVERDPPDPACADRPFVGELVALRGTDVASTFATAEDGAFNVSLSPDEYTIRRAGEGSTPPTCASEGPIIVLTGTWTRANVTCDTGIR